MNDKLVALLYIILRDHIPIGEIAKIIADIENIDEEILFENKNMELLVRAFLQRLE